MSFDPATGATAHDDIWGGTASAGSVDERSRAGGQLDVDARVGGVATQRTAGGGSATVTPLGVSTTGALTNRSGDTSVVGKIGDGYYNRIGLAGGTQTDAAGRSVATGEGSLRTGVRDASVTAVTPGGAATASVGEASTGADVSIRSVKEANGSHSTEASAQVGPRVRDARVTGQSADGDVTASAGVGSASAGPDGKVSVGYDAKTDTASIGVDGRGPGVRVANLNANGSIKGVGSAEAGVGGVSTDGEVKNGRLSYGPNAFTGSAEKIETPGLKIDDVNLNAHSEDHRTQASLTGSAGNTNTFRNVKGSFNLNDGLDLSVDGKKDKDGNAQDGVSVGSWGGDKIRGHASTENAHADARVDNFSLSTFAANKAALKIDGDGVNASVSDGKVSALSAQNVGVDARVGDVDAGASAGELHVKRAYAKEADAHVGLDGANAHLKEAGYDTAAAKNVNIGGGVGDSGANLQVGDVSGGSARAGKLDATSNLKDTSVEGKDLSTHALRATDVDAVGNIGGVRGEVGAKKIETLASTTDSASLKVKDFGLSGNAQIDNSRTTAVNVEDGRAGLNIDGKDVAGVRGSARADASIGQLKADYNVLDGTGKVAVKDAGYGGEIKNASVNIGDRQIALPDASARLNASGGASTDLKQGAANVNASLAGTNVNLGGVGSITLPEAAQASAGVNLSQGAANLNVGGKDGVGADVNLAQGKFTVDAFGNRIDVAGAAKQAGSFIADAGRSALSFLGL